MTGRLTRASVGSRPRAGIPVVQRLFLLPAILLATAPAHVAATVPGTLSVAGNAVTYYAARGDTLSSIATRFTSNPGHWIEIGRINSIRSETSIPVGTGIRIPARLLPEKKAEGTVQALSGKVVAVTAEGKTVPVREGAKITEGMRIDTDSGGFVTIALPDKSKLSLLPQSRVQLTALRAAEHTATPRTEIALLRGKVESRVTPLGKEGGSYDVRTPFAMASVRGTHFKVGLSNTFATNEVLSGSVSIIRPGGETVLLGSGTGNSVSATGMGATRDLLAAPGMTKLSAIDSAVALALGPMPGATAYRVQIARDSQAHDIIAERVAERPDFRLDGLAPGHYYARISAIDASGLEGQPHLHAFRMQESQGAAAAGEQSRPPAPKVSGASGKKLLLTWPGAPGQRFIVQIARDADFSWLVTTMETVGPLASVPRPAFGTYYARIRAVPSPDVSPPYSLAQAFIVSEEWVIHEGSLPPARQAATGKSR